MPRNLPPLETFRFFEAAARHLNFTHAAGEMHVTHGAVSQRIKRLEEDLGTPLFRRSGRGMLLTDEGRRLLERVRAAIGEITEGVEAIRSSNRDRILTVSMVPGFATYWLLPRLAEFIERHPDIEVNIRPTLSLTDFTRDDVDMAVRFGPGAWPGLISIKLYDEELVPVCSPAFRRRRLPRAPGDLLKMPLLHDERQPWSIWFKAVGLDYRDARQRQRYGDQRSSQRTWNPAGWFGFFPGACPRDTRTSSCIRPAPSVWEKFKCSRSGSSSRSDPSNERTPSSLKSGRRHRLAYGSIFFNWNPPAQPSFHAALFRATISALAHH